MITTCMVSLVATIIWRLPLVVVLLFFLVFAALEGAYMSSSLRKVPDGAWFTLLLALILSSIFILWRWGKEQQWAAEAEDRVMPAQLLRLSPSSSTVAGDKDTKIPPQLSLTSTFGGGAVSTTSGLVIFFDKTDGGDEIIPKVFTQFILRFKARPEVIVFFHMRPLSVPTIPTEERFVITRATPYIPSCFRLTLRHGYMDNVLTPDLGSIILEQLADFIRGGASDAGLALTNLPPTVRDEIEALDCAKSSPPVYVLGKQVMRVRGQQGSRARWLIRVLTLESFLWIRENSRTKLADLDMDYNNLVEVGFVKEI